MQSAANYAFANRSAVSHRVSETLRDHMKKEIQMDLIYDVSHNIARIEDHTYMEKRVHAAFIERERRGHWKGFGIYTLRI